MFQRNSIAGIAVALAVGLGPAAQAGEQILPLVKITYGLTLKSKSSVLIADARGVVIVENLAHCDHWTSAVRVRLKATGITGKSFEAISNVTYRIPKSLRGLTFEHEHRGRSVENLRGVIRRLSSGRRSVSFDSATLRQTTLPRGTLLPYEYYLRLVDLAKKGNRRVTSIVFWGNESKGPTKVIDQILGPAASRRLAQFDPALSNISAWRIKSTLFDGVGEMALPSAEDEGVLYANGIYDAPVMNAGGFEMIADVVNYERLKPPKCSG